MMTDRQNSTDHAVQHEQDRELVEALRRAEGLDARLPSDARSAAYRLAVTRGYCRLADPDSGEPRNAVLPPQVARAAADELAVRVSEARIEVDQLPARYDAVGTRSAGERLVCGWLELRMDAWAAWQSLDAAHSACLTDSGADQSGLDRALDAACEALEAFDDALQDQQEVLSVAVATGLLDHWRAGLGGLFAESLPWWLDGRLERAAAQLLDDVVATLPSAAAWRAIHGAGKTETGTSLSPARDGQDAEPARLRVAMADLPTPVEELTLAASAEGPPPQNRPLRWLRPGSEPADVAQMLLPVEPPPTVGQPVRLSFFCGGQRAERWIGQPIELAGIRRTVDERAGVDFEYDVLYRASRLPGGLVLRVGEQQEAWEWDEC